MNMTFEVIVGSHIIKSPFYSKINFDICIILLKHFMNAKIMIK